MDEEEAAPPRTRPLPRSPDLLPNAEELSESTDAPASEDQQLIRELRSEVLQMRSSVVPPNLTRNLEAKTEVKSTRFSFQRDL